VECAVPADRRRPRKTRAKGWPAVTAEHGKKSASLGRSVLLQTCALDLSGAELDIMVNNHTPMLAGSVGNSSLVANCDQHRETDTKISISIIQLYGARFS
jgi:hypothetical protein